MLKRLLMASVVALSLTVVAGCEPEEKGSETGTATESTETATESMGSEEATGSEDATGSEEATGSESATGDVESSDTATE